MYLAGQNSTIDTGDIYFNEIAKTNASGREQGVKFLHRERILKLAILETKPLDARIEHSRWIVDCPNCNSAEFAFEDKLFFCSNCKNSDIGGKTRKVKMPNERKEIENILNKRPIKNRHWYPNETLEDLEKENELHKLEVI